MPTFRPKSDKELNDENLLPKGEYDFEVIGAENKTFKTGSVGIALKVGVFTATGAQRLVNDNLIFQDNCMFKVSQFSKCVGIYEKYDAGEIDAQDCVGRAGKCRLDIEEEGQYPAKNKITSYVIPKAEKPAPTPRQAQSAKVTPLTTKAAPKPNTEDDVPF